MPINDFSLLFGGDYIQHKVLLYCFVIGFYLYNLGSITTTSALKISRIESKTFTSPSHNHLCTQKEKIANRLSLQRNGAPMATEKKNLCKNT